jgi:signal peptidase I
MLNPVLLRKLFQYLLRSIILLIFIRVFLFDIYKIPSESMSNTLEKGDFILLNKPIALWNYLDSKFGSLQNEADFQEIKSIFSKNSILVFKTESSKLMIKRCYGVPGDTLSIYNQDILINDNEISLPKLAKRKYRFRIVNKKNFKSIFKNLRFYDNLKIIDYKNSLYECTLNSEDSLKLIQTGIVDDLQLYSSFESKKNQNYWRNFETKNGEFILKNYILPKTGMKIKLNHENLNKYHDLLYKYENAKITYEKFNYILDGKEADFYVFKNNYYFLLGDNFHNSHDSRFIGPIPEISILGSVKIVLFSSNQDRFFKKIN